MGDVFSEFAELGTVQGDLSEEMVITDVSEAYAEMAAETEDSKGSKKRTIEIGNDVIQIVAGIAASRTPGVAAMTGGSGLIEILGRKNLAKGVRVEVNDGSADIDVHIIAAYGVNLGQLFLQLQRNVKEAVETMTGLAVNAVNVYTQGIAEEEPSAKAEVKDL